MWHVFVCEGAGGRGIRRNRFIEEKSRPFIFTTVADRFVCFTTVFYRFWTSLFLLRWSNDAVMLPVVDRRPCRLCDGSTVSDL